MGDHGACQREYRKAYRAFRAARDEEGRQTCVVAQVSSLVTSDRMPVRRRRLLAALVSAIRAAGDDSLLADALRWAAVDARDLDGRPAQALRHLRAALALARRHRDTVDEINILQDRAETLRRCGRLEAALRATARGAARARAAGSVGREAIFGVVRATVLVFLGRVDEAQVAVDGAEPLVNAYRDRLMRWNVALNHVHILARSGDVRGAADLATSTAADLRPTDHPDFRATFPCEEAACAAVVGDRARCAGGMPRAGGGGCANPGGGPPRRRGWGGAAGGGGRHDRAGFHCRRALPSPLSRGMVAVREDARRALALWAGHATLAGQPDRRLAACAWRAVRRTDEHGLRAIAMASLAAATRGNASLARCSALLASRAHGLLPSESSVLLALLR